MKVVVLDDIKGRNREISELAEKKGHKVISCSSANSFMEAIQDEKIDMYIIELSSWNSGLAIYKYINIIEKMGVTPAIIFNAPENLVALSGRDENEADIILSNEVTADEIVEAI